MKEPKILPSLKGAACTRLMATRVKSLAIIRESLHTTDTAPLLFWWFAAAMGAAFLLFFAFVAACARLATDDFCALDMAQHLGVTGAVMHWWQSWTGRWLEKGLSGLVSLSVAKNAVVTSYVWGLMIGFLLCLRFFAHQALRALDLELAWWKELLLSLAFTALFFFSTVERAQVWFWLSGSASHTVPLLPFLVLLGYLLKKTPSRLDKTLACGCAVLVTGAGEEVTAAMGAAFGFFMIRAPVSHRKAMLGPLLFFALSAFITFTAPGNWQRMNAESQGQHIEFLRLIKSVAHLLKVHILLRGGWILAVIGLGLATGVALEIRKGSTVTKRVAKKCMLIALGAFACALTSSLPPIIAFRGNAPARTWAVTTLVLEIGIFAVALLIAASFQPRFPRATPKVFYSLGILSWIGCAVAIAAYWRVDLPRTRSTVALFDDQYAFLRSKRSSCQGTITVALLPQAQWPVPQWVPLGQPMPQADHWISTCMRDALGLPCDLRRDRF